MTERIWVRVAGDGRRVPVEGRPGAYFDPGKPHEVRLTPFIQRRMKEGDLVKTNERPPPPSDPAAETTVADPTPVPEDTHAEG